MNVVVAPRLLTILGDPAQVEALATEREASATAAEEWAQEARGLKIGLVGYAGIAALGIAALLWFRR